MQCLDRHSPSTARFPAAAERVGSGRPGPAHAGQPAPRPAWARLVAVPGRRPRLLLGGAYRRRLARRRRRRSRPSRSRRCCCVVALRRCSASTAPTPPEGRSASEDGMAWPVIRLLVAALFAWSASLLTPLDGGAQLALWVGLRRARHRRTGAQRAAACSRLDRVERWVLVGDEATAERLQRLRAAARLRRPSSAPSPPSRTAPSPADRVAALEVVDRYQRRPRRDRHPARRRRGPARPRPRLQVDRRAGQPAAPPARPARGPRGDAEPGRRRAADRGRGAGRPRRRPLRRPRPPRRPQDQGQRRRPGDERGEEHRPRARAACPRTCTR